MIRYIFLLVLCAFSQNILAEPAISYDLNIQDNEHILTEKTASALSKKEKISRESAVKIITEGGHGSGTYIKFQDVYLILTAAHVVTDVPDGKNIIVVAPSGEIKKGNIVYLDHHSDISLILLKTKMSTRKHSKYNPNYKTKIIPGVGTKTVYSGYPAYHSLLTIRGSIAGYEVDDNGKRVIIINTFGWFGSSGSGVFSENGNLIGILYGVSVSRYQVLDNVIWVSPIGNIDNYILMKNICGVAKAKFCP